MLSLPLTAGEARAEEPPPRTSVTMSPLLASASVAEVTAEFSATPHLGLAVIGGGGEIGIAGGGKSILVEVGGQASYYLQPRFDGWHAGIEALWGHSRIDIGDWLILDDLNAGLFVGHKYISPWGATLVAQVGGTVVFGDQLRLAPILNLNAGYSF